MATENLEKGTLQINVINEQNEPVSGARVQIFITGGTNAEIDNFTTDASGQSAVLELAAPPKELSLEKFNDIRPYSEYTAVVNADGYEQSDVAGIEILAGTNSTINILLHPVTPTANSTDILIPEHTLYGDYPPKIPEISIKPINAGGEIVLSRVVIPETIIVHDGVPGDTTATDYYVPYTDYIKNVASSEIYATWPEATIRANVLAIMSFTLNRVFTEWYRGKGYNFTITSSTAYDQKWIYGRNIYDSISVIVDEMFENYISKPDVKQPILTQYCDGRRTTCPGGLSQWGSLDLGESGYTPIEILRKYYGETVYINTAEQIEGIPSSWPGYNLTEGSRGEKVRQVQEQLDRISMTYSAIPRVAIDGIYGTGTAEAVRKFQEIFGLGVSGVIDYRTWYKISQIYVGLTKIAE
ncbi:MAG: peptidoglycan-binding protein [Lachnospiraceae bacterium]|nr:peptidoglycan-binding protein [Lachnospiraceae bacterium]